jgi:hypothetical protein
MLYLPKKSAIYLCTTKINPLWNQVDYPIEQDYYVNVPNQLAGVNVYWQVRSILTRYDWFVTDDDIYYVYESGQNEYNTDLCPRMIMLPKHINIIIGFIFNYNDLKDMIYYYHNAV